MTDHQMRTLQIKALPVAAPWTACLIPVDVLPAPSEQADALRLFLSAFSAKVLSENDLMPEVFLQTWKMGVDGAADRYQKNISTWLPSIGVGVWPLRTPPQRLTQAAALDCAAAVLAGEERELSAYHLSHVSAGATAAANAVNVMLGFGMTLQIFAPGSINTLQKRGNETFLPQVQDPAYRHYRFYVPLLDQATILSGTTEELDTWLCGGQLYIRESAEDKGVLLLWRSDHLPTLAPWLDKQFPDTSAT